jgi:signal transduction histidine kinase
MSAAPVKPVDAVRRGEQRLSDTLLNTAAYITVAAGYLTAILLSGDLSVPGFALLTLGNLAWVWCFWRVANGPRPTTRRLYLLLVGLIGATLVTLGAPWRGANLDWLLPIATVSVITVALPWRQAALLSLGVWLVTALNILALDSTSAPVNYAYLAQNQISIGIGFVFVFAFSLVFSLQIDQRARAEALVAQLEAAQARLRASASEAEELAITRERNRVAREIHDTLGHYLTILTVKLETAIKLEEHADARLRDELVEARRVATECLAEVRRSVAALRPADASATRLSEALTRLVAELEGAAPDVEAALDIEGPADELTPELRVALFRCAQEALTNVRKHAQATKVLVRLRVDARRAELTVLDNGLGAKEDEPDHQPGFGLLGMRERIALLGGTASAGPQADRGWRVEVVVPVAMEQTAAEDQPLPATLEG